MDSEKYIGIDVHRESISIAVLNSAGKIVLECVVEAKASIILQFIEGCVETYTSGWKKEPPARRGFRNVGNGG